VSLRLGKHVFVPDDVAAEVGTGNTGLGMEKFVLHENCRGETWWLLVREVFFADIT
jgi:hypothetical protein